ncbi:putative phosphoenolpyruvate synthase [Azoarcus olearius]|uniref:PEP/pyruvate-binding domain-containing protein n=1 Tax=Azoarcus sp. (strain BH72) TaxID=418699 RepID=UPI0008063A9B|nr:PEP/pyruvate-binding domain-containing protein [Azoarcus olearius]ANQ85669.1 putative phosphoenolpyruvate synthase [Azoarcus olearius]
MSAVPLLMDLPDAAGLTALAGGKGAGLGLLARYGLPVPAGAVLTTAAYHRAAAETGLALLPDGSDGGALGARRAALLRAPLPDAVAYALEQAVRERGWTDLPLAVRSSAPQEDSGSASFAGIHHSVLNVVGAAALADAVREVWASLWTPQAAAYRARFGIPEGEAAMAVVVMPLLPARASGVAFSCDPASGREDLYVIEAVHGLGEALVGGLVAGERTVLQEDPVSGGFAVQRRDGGGQAVRVLPAQGGGTRREPLTPQAAPALDDARACELAALVRDAAHALDFGAPWYDLEWAWDGAKFWLLQARPVTARPWHTYPALAGQNAIWSNGNTRDVVPLPMQAMDWAVSRGLVDLLLEAGYRSAGFPLLAGARRARLFNGRLYLNAAFIQWEGYDGFGVSPAAMNRLLGGHHPEIRVTPRDWRARLKGLAYMLRYLVRTPALRRRGREQARAAFDICRRWRAEDLRALSDAELATRLASAFPHVQAQDGLLLLQGSSGGNLHMLLELVERYLPGQGHSLVAALMAGGEGSVSARQGYELMAIARRAMADPRVSAWLQAGAPYDFAALPADAPFRTEFARFLDTYGHRSVHESYVRSPRWREEPAYLLDSLPALAAVDHAALVRRQREAAAAAWAQLAAALPRSRRGWARQWLKAARDETPDRELARSAMTAYGEVARLRLLEVGRRMQAEGMLERPEHAFDLLPWEMEAALHRRLAPAAFRERVAERRHRFAEWERHCAADVIEEGSAPPAPVEGVDASAAAGGWRGIAVGTGHVEGIARLIDHPAEGARLGAGEILVAPATDPGWTPLFLRAGGLVMETGGYLSHGAIVAREFGIPAVVNLPGIRSVLQDGQRIRVDGRSGRVEVLA